MLTKTIGTPIKNAIFTAIKNTTNAPILDAKLKIFEAADDATSGM
ncbi:MAG: hypothetical protein Rpha_0377 [Candidatus Ruthia sp. Apha_13_S6]|nr:hypothetical protein [Candidatus Ruthia sp. Apha_13_S6]